MKLVLENIAMERKKCVFKRLISFSIDITENIAMYVKSVFKRLFSIDISILNVLLDYFW